MQNQNQNQPTDDDDPAPNPFENSEEKAHEAIPEHLNQKDS